MGNSIDPQTRQDIEKDWSLTLPSSLSEEDLVALLAAEINRLILQDFSRLVSILYRVDIPESRLKNTLKENPRSDAGRIIAVLILDRQREKKRLREMFKQKPADDGEERW